jgi:quercetin dioxygenase-like cupin family protein
MKTEHTFAGGMYCRRLEIPAGTAIVSKVHKTEHLFIGVSGQLQVAGQGPTYILGPGDVVPSPVGTKRAVFALTDVIVITVHKTELTSIDGLEDELMEASEDSLYDINNQPKAGVLTSGGQQWLG